MLNHRERADDRRGAKPDFRFLRWRRKNRVAGEGQDGGGVGGVLAVEDEHLFVKLMFLTSRGYD